MANISKIKTPDGTTYNLKDSISGYTTNTGTVTSVTIKATSPIAVDSTSAITSSGTRTISHANSGATAGTYKSVTVNATGHVTAGTNPTTLSGYGITDAKIANGVITLGSNTITPALSTHTHTTSIATSSGTNQITLAHGGKYAITAGGTSYVFTMPSDNNNYVNQSGSTTANWRKLLLHYKDDSSATAAVTNSTNVVYGAVGIAAQPSTGTIRASVYRVADNVELQYNSTTKSLDFVFL